MKKFAGVLVIMSIILTMSMGVSVFATDNDEPYTIAKPTTTVIR